MIPELKHMPKSMVLNHPINTSLTAPVFQKSYIYCSWFIISLKTHNLQLHIVIEVVFHSAAERKIEHKFEDDFYYFTN